MTRNIVQLLLGLVYQRPFLNQKPYHEVKLNITVHIGINTTSCPAPFNSSESRWTYLPLFINFYVRNSEDESQKLQGDVK